MSMEPSPSPTEMIGEPVLPLRLLWMIKTRTAYLHFFFLMFYTFVAARVLRLRFKYVLLMGLNHFTACWLLHYTLMPQYDELGTYNAKSAAELFIGDTASWAANVMFVAFLVYGAYEGESELQHFFLSKVRVLCVHCACTVRTRADRVSTCGGPIELG